MAASTLHSPWDQPQVKLWLLRTECCGLVSSSSTCYRPFAHLLSESHCVISFLFRALADILRQQGPIPIAHCEREVISAIDTSPKENTPVRSSSKNHYTPVRTAKPTPGKCKLMALSLCWSWWEVSVMSLLWWGRSWSLCYGWLSNGHSGLWRCLETVPLEWHWHGTDCSHWVFRLEESRLFMVPVI